MSSSDNKTIGLGVRVNQSELSKARADLTSLITLANAAQRAITGVTGNGGRQPAGNAPAFSMPQAGPLGMALGQANQANTQNRNANGVVTPNMGMQQLSMLRNINTGITDLNRKLQGGLGDQTKLIAAQRKEVDGLAESYKHLVKLASEFAGLSGGGGGFGGGSGPPSAAGGAAGDNRRRKESQNDNERIVEKSRLYSAGMTTSAVGTVAGHALSGVAGYIQSDKLHRDRNEAATRGMEHQIVSGLLRGDARDLVHLNRSRDMMYRASGTDAANASYVGGAVTSGAGALGDVAMMIGTGGAGAGAKLIGGAASSTLAAQQRMQGAGGFVGHGLGIADNLRSFFGGGAEVAEMQSIQEAVALSRQKNPLEDLAMDSMMAHAGTRVRGSHRLRGQHFRAYGKAGGMMDMGEAIGLAESLNQSIPLEMVMGKGGTTSSSTKRSFPKLEAKLALDAYLASPEAKSGVRSDIPVLSRTQGSRVHELTQAYENAQDLREDVTTTRTKGGLGVMDYALKFRRRGFNENAMGQYMGQLTGNGASAQQANKVLEDIFARGFKRGIVDGNVAQTVMGGALAYGQGNRNQDYGMIANLISSATTARTVVDPKTGRRVASQQDVEDVIGGVRSVEGYQRSNAFQVTSGMSSAVRAIPGLAPQTIEGLGSLSMSELIGFKEGAGGGLLAQQGVTRANAQQVAQDKINAVASRLGVDISGGIEGLGGKEKALLAQGLKNTIGMKSDEEAMGFVNWAGKAQTMGTLSDVDLAKMQREDPTFAKAMRGSGDNAEVTLAVQMKTMLKLLDEEGPMVKAMKEMLKPGAEIDKAIAGGTLKTANEFGKGKAYLVNVVGEWTPPTQVGAPK